MKIINYPIGVIGNFVAAKEYVQAQLLPNDDVMILDSKAGIDEVKQLRVFLMHRGMERRVGVIYGLNKWKNSQQAVLLKIFEQLPEFNAVYYTASFLPNVVILTRSILWKLPSVRNKLIEDLSVRLLETMQQGGSTHEMMNGLKIVAQVQSWVDDGVIGQKEQSVILKSLGLKLVVIG